MNRDERSKPNRTSHDEPVDATWLRRVRDVYEPDPMTPAQRVAFDARLEARIERARRRAWIVAVAGPALVAAAAGLLWLALAPEAPSPTRETNVATDVRPGRPASLRAWQHDVIAASDPSDSATDAPRNTDLPTEYQALDSLFLAGARGDQRGR